MTAIERFKLQLKAIADAIRDKTGSTKAIPFNQIASSIVEIEGGSIPETIILLDDSGNEIAAVRTDEEVEITATANDIRLGTTAVTEDGITEGEKEIPSYQTAEGFEIIMPEKEFAIENFKRFEFTKLQVLTCAFNTNVDDSVFTDKVSIDGKVYLVNSTDVLSTVTTDTERLAIKLGVSNKTDKPYIMRYFTYKEEY